MKENYGIAIAEVLDILEHTDEKSVNKISKSFIKFLKENAEYNYKVDIDYSKPLEEMKLNKKTLSIISMISYSYWCNEEEKKEMIAKLRENDIKREQQIREKYHTDNLFEKNKLDKNIDEPEIIRSLIVAKKPNIFAKIIDKINKIMRRGE